MYSHNIRNDISTVSFLQQMDYCISFLHNIQKVDLRKRFTVGYWNGLNPQINSIIAVFGEQIFQQNIGQFYDVGWEVLFLGELDGKS